MYTVRKKKSQRIKNFISKHAHHRHGERNTTARDSSVPAARSTTPTYPSNHAPTTTSTANSIIYDYPVSYDGHDGRIYHNNLHNNNTNNHNPRNSTSSNTDLNFNSNFSADYERYMRTRQMNMQRIHELESAKKFNDITQTNGISPLEKEILDLADSGGMNSLAPLYSQSAPPRTFPFGPPAMPTHSSTPSFLYEYASPEVHFPLTQQQKYLTAPPILMTPPTNPLSPHTELEKFRTSFAAASPFNIASPPTTYFPRQQTTYPNYFEHLHETTPPTMLTATEKPRSSWPNYSVALSPALEKDFMWKEPPQPAPAAPSNPAPPSPEAAKASEFTRARTPDLFVTPSADSRSTTTATTTSTSRTPPSNLAPILEHAALSPQAYDASRDRTLELQQDLENLLVNIQEHYKRRPSALPKAPPPSPNDYAPLQQRILEESAVFADFDFTQPDPTPSQFLSPMSNNLRRSDQLSPYSISPTSSRSQSPSSFSQSSTSHTSQSTTPSHSSSPSPVQFYLSPATSDSESYQPPTTTTTISTFTDVPTTTTHIPSPTLASLPTPAPISSPALSTLSNAPPFHPPPALAPAPPQNEVDCQGNLPAPPPPPVFDQLDLSQLRSPRIPPPDFDYSAYDFQGNLIAPPPVPALAPALANRNDQDDDEPVAMHNTTVSTTARHDPNLTSSSTTVSSITATPTTEISTVSTATRATTTAIPTTPTSERRDVPTSIATMQTTTHVIDVDTGVVADATITTTSISEGGASPVLTSTTSYEERAMTPEELSGTRSKLLEEIRVGKCLRKTPTALPAPLPTSSSVTTVMTAADAKAALANALASRRSQISDESESSDDESGDDEAANW